MKRFFSKDELKKRIIDILINENKRPLPTRILFKFLKIYNHKDQKQCLEIVNELINQGIIKTTKIPTNLVINYQPYDVDLSKTYQGEIRINSSNNGFVKIFQENKSFNEYFIHKSNINGALDGDTVEIGILKKPPYKGMLDAKVLKIINHAKDFYVCTVSKNNFQNIKLIPDDEKMYFEIKLDDYHGLIDGQKILVKIAYYEDKYAYGTISRILGHKDDVGMDILSVVLDLGVKPEFSDESIKEANSLSFKIDDYQKTIRKDLTSLPIITIDPATSKDFDDAIYVKKENNNYRLYVCIADVAHYVKWKGALDLEAERRGTSIYLVDRVIPMLPHILSNDICSLNPNVKRFSITCEMLIDNKGNYLEIKIYPSIIKNHRRFNYDEVNDYFNNKNNLDSDSKEIKEMLVTARELHDILDHKKQDLGYIEFNIPEPLIIVDKTGFPIEIRNRQTGTAQKMIEDFMVAANECVTIYADKKHWPFIYRIHDRPNESKIKNFLIESKKIAFKITTNIENLSSKDISKWLKDNTNNSNPELVNLLLLRMMSKAEYSTDNIGHFGLASEKYTHFTSPIRRYPDLLVARSFWMREFEKNKYSSNQLDEFTKNLPKQCELSSKNEIIAINCERAVNEMKFAEYMSKQIGKQFNGFVSSISSFGMFVELPNTIEGLVRINNIGSDYFVYNEENNTIVGQKTKQIFTLGTKVRIEVIAADKNSRKIDFKIVNNKTSYENFNN